MRGLRACDRNLTDEQRTAQHQLHETDPTLDVETARVLDAIAHTPRTLTERTQSFDPAAVVALQQFGLLLVGGDGAWRVLAREPMLRSRIYRRVVCAPLSSEQVCVLLPRYHPIYAATDAELLLFVDDHFAHGNLRDWAAFTATAVELCRAAGAVSSQRRNTSLIV